MQVETHPADKTKFRNSQEIKKSSDNEERTIGYSYWLFGISAIKNSPLPSLPAGTPAAAGNLSAHTPPGIV